VLFAVASLVTHKGEDMVWITLSQTESRTFFDIIAEVEGGSPRAVAVVAGAFVEEHLTKLMRWRLVKEPIKSGVDPQNEMFRPGGPLGDFSNKLKLAYLMGLVSKDAYKELDAIRTIRNEFAHKVEINRWNVQRISALCENLVIWERIKIKLRRLEAGPGKLRNLRLEMGDSLEEGEQEIPMIDLIDKEPPLPANERYVAACKFYVAAFSIMINEGYQIRDPLF
jgi:hypothetical protein